MKDVVSVQPSATDNGLGGKSAWAPVRVSAHRKDRVPKYVAVSQQIAQAISSGALAPGDPLPSQRELSRSFGVTTMTLRQGLQLLAEDGLVSAQPGRGTFVMPLHYRLSLGPLNSFAHEIERAGHKLRTEVLKFEVVATPAHLSTLRSFTSSAYEIERLRFVDEQPLVLQTSLLPLSLGRRLRPDQLVEHSLYDLLATKAGRRVTHAVETIQSVTLSADQAAVLERAEGQPALLSVRQTFSVADQPIMEDRAILPGDSVMLSTIRRSDYLDLNYTLHSDLTADATSRSPQSPR